MARWQSRKQHCSLCRGRSERYRSDAVFQHNVCHPGNCFVGSGTISLNNDRLVLPLSCIECLSELLHANSLVLKINRRNGAPGDTDDLLVALWSERKARDWHRNRDAMLQDQVRAQQQEKQEQENKIDRSEEHT